MVTVVIYESSTLDLFKILLSFYESSISGLRFSLSLLVNEAIYISNIETF